MSALDDTPIENVLRLFLATVPSPSERHVLSHLHPTLPQFYVDCSTAPRTVHYFQSRNLRQLETMATALLVAIEHTARRGDRARTKNMIAIALRTLARYAAQRHRWRDIVQLIDRDELMTTDQELLVALLPIPASPRNWRYDSIRLLVEILRAVALYDLRNRFKEQG